MFDSIALALATGPLTVERMQITPWPSNTRLFELTTNIFLISQ